MAGNYLYYGDNLDILRHRIEKESVDLIYLDPPFNSNADYNVIFREQSGEKSAAQIKAFTDTWHWDQHDTERAYEDILTNAPNNVAKMLEAMVSFIGRNDVTAYLVMMTQRLVELHRVLKPTGSLYLHCDPSASHYLKIVLDTIFGPERFVNEIIWQRTSAHNDPSRFGRVHDVLLFYAKGEKRTWNTLYDQPDEAYFAAHDFEKDGNGKLYRKRDLTAPAHGRDSGQYEWKGKFPPPGRMWAYTRENMERLEREERIAYTQTGMPRLKIYADDLPGIPWQDMWARPELWLNSAASERLGYPTQKPLALLERVIASSSNPGDVVADPFCVTGDTLIVTLEGLRPIRAVQEGDLVLTHTGRYQRVARRYERPYQGPLLRITRSRSNIVLNITPNHPILAVRAQSCPYDERRCLPRECHYHRQGRHKDCPRYRENYHLEWIPAGELRPGDWVYYPTTQAEAPANVSLPDSTPPNAKPIPAELPVTPVLLEWLGYFAAEGFVDGYSVHFANYEDAEHIAALGDTLFGVPGVITPRPYRSKHIRFSSRALSRWMEQTLGRGAANKRLPNWIFGLDVIGRRALLRALLRSDGSFRQDKPADASHSYRYASASPTLAHQVMRLLLAEQIAGSFTKLQPTSQGRILQGRTIQVNHPSYQVAVYDAKSVNQLLEATGEAPAYEETILRQPYDSYPFDVGHLYSIRQIERYEQATTVFNLEVEEDHSYVTATFTAHNCGCGTAICAAQKLERRWIGIDITHLAVSLMKSRLKSMFGLDPNKDYKVLGEPTDVEGARQLALDDRYQFQYWAVSLIEATAQEQKKGADKGIDGVIPFIDGANRHRETIIVQVKSGHVTSAHIRDLKGVLEREKAAMGLYICLEPPTKDMRDEAVSAGFYKSDLWAGSHGDHRWPRIQLRTIEELLAGHTFELPPRPVQFRQAARVQAPAGVTTPDLWTTSEAMGTDAELPGEDDV